MNPLADRVRAERLTRKWSVRYAASQTGGVLSNTWWARFEDGLQPLTDGIRQGVAAAFGWPDDWATQAPAGDTTRAELDALRADVDRLERLVLERGERLEREAPRSPRHARQPRK